MTLIKNINQHLDGCSYRDIAISILLSAAIICGIEGFPIGSKILEVKEFILSGDSLYLNISFIALILLSIIFIGSVLHNIVSNRALKDVKSHKEKYQDYFKDVITPNNNVSQYFAPLSTQDKSHLELTDIVDPKNRTILLSELKGMHAIITGSEKDRLRELYFGMGFIPELGPRLSSNSWLTRVEAIQEVRQFQITSYYEKVFEMINDEHDTVRRNAILSRIVLDPDPINILHDINTPLNTWERHNILSALEKLPSHKVPLFCTLYLEAPMHVEFLRELCLHFHQKIVLEDHKNLIQPVALV